MNDVSAIIHELCTTWPKLHGERGERHLSLDPPVLEWIAAHVRPGDVTLETGCGYSTVVFSPPAAATRLSLPPQPNTRGAAPGASSAASTSLA
ncbi:MAG: hypothetical protein WCC69_09550 [Pirellulales bacterium]